MPRTLPRVTLLVALALLIGSDAGAQRARRVRKKPFATFNESARRLRDSLFSAKVRVQQDSVMTPASPFIMAATHEMMLRDSLVAVARAQVGARYRLGAEQPGKAFDCSGLVRFVMGMMKLDVPRTADEQARVGIEVPRDLAALKPGDLLTFGTSRRITHIGIYTGDGKVVHASTSKRRVIETDMKGLGPKLLRTWQSTRRLLALADSTQTNPTKPIIQP